CAGRRAPRGGRDGESGRTPAAADRRRGGGAAARVRRACRDGASARRRGGVASVDVVRRAALAARARLRRGGRGRCSRRRSCRLGSGNGDRRARGGPCGRSGRRNSRAFDLGGSRDPVRRRHRRRCGARGAANTSTLANERGTGAVLLLLPALIAFVAAVVVARALAPGLGLLERWGRRGPASVRLAALSLARHPGRAAIAVAFLVVSL